MEWNDISLKLKNYKCFGDEFQGFETVKPMNVIVGRNNSGKSTLLELVQYSISPFDPTPFSHKNKVTQVLLSAPLSKGEVQKVFKPGNHGNGFPVNMDHWEVGQFCVGRKMTALLPPDGAQSKTLLSFDVSLPKYARAFEGRLVQALSNPFALKRFKRLRAERDIRPEPDRPPGLQDNGVGATNTVLPSNLVESTLLEELNRIMEPDASFTDIVVQQREDGNWEVYLEEREKGRIALSQSGSGLQTVLLLLILLYLVPHEEKRNLDTYVFGLEELENNVHPALQRRLFLYLRNMAIQHGSLFFITSHSNVAIDLFSTDQHAQLIHVTHDGCRASASRVQAYVECQGILDDLDVRASDLLQSNGIIWVEGPSDRLYLNRWIELWSDGKLHEGTHYQCVFYGGRLLAHLSASAPEDEPCDLQEALRILRVNRNAIVVIDSDKRYRSQRLNATKKRIKAEMLAIGTTCWVTKGREIENYISPSAVASCYGREPARAVSVYESFSEYLDKFEAGEGRKFLANKVLFAERMCRGFCRDHIDGTLDLRERIDETCRIIRQWNGGVPKDVPVAASVPQNLRVAGTV